MAMLAEARAAGYELNNRLWLAILRRRLAIGTDEPWPVEEWRPGEPRHDLQLVLPLRSEPFTQRRSTRC